jgi:hypothetical protein
MRSRNVNTLLSKTIGIRPTRSRDLLRLRVLKALSRERVLSAVPAARLRELELSSVRVAHSRELELSSVPAARSKELELSSVRVAHSRELELSSVPAARLRELELSSVRVAHSRELELSSVRAAPSKALVLSAVPAARSKELVLSAVRVARSKELVLSSVRIAHSKELERYCVRKASFKLPGPPPTPPALPDPTVQTPSRSSRTSRGLTIVRESEVDPGMPHLHSVSACTPEPPTVGCNLSISMGKSFGLRMPWQCLSQVTVRPRELFPTRSLCTIGSGPAFF